ncbi:MAG: hypothetical protein NVSMB1_23480 [Polyangiales bacterium]
MKRPTKLGRAGAGAGARGRRRRRGRGRLTIPHIFILWLYFDRVDGIAIFFQCMWR